MGHAGAIITGNDATAEAKTQALREAGARIILSPAEIGSTARETMGS
jgi:succinyl-CoA synthetase alpha subunit